MIYFRRATATLGILALSSCAVGPDYKRPDAPVPTTYKEAAGWVKGEPRDMWDRGPWWRVYNDPMLDGLERQVSVSNQNLALAEANFRQSVALVAQARASFFPSIGASFSATRSKRGGTSRSGGGASTIALPGTAATTSTVSLGGGSTPTNSYDLGLNASWELDIWGSIRRTVESDVANAQADAATLASARLSAQGQLATDYLGLRVQDELQRLLDRTVKDYDGALTITRNQYKAGIVSRADVVQAETQLESARAQAINIGVQRAVFEHAIALLIGKAPADLTIAPAETPIEVPAMPAGVPSELLERRPDIAAEERKMQAENALIGVAVAAYYPTVDLSGSYGFAGGSPLGHLVRASNSLWSFGASAADTLIDWGARGAAVDQARASYDAAVASYREAVLTGFQQIEDELASLRILAQQAAAVDIAVASAQEAERLTMNQYRAGTVPYSTVLTAENTALGEEQTAVNVRLSRLNASVALIEALGGGWDASQLPSRASIVAGE